jgi:4-amino-4-deoxy-L-arabinose transferase-like glycosyltransferase
VAGRRRWLALPPVAGLVAVLAASAKGLYVSPDAVFYVGTARNWVDGRGFTPPAGLPPVEHFPPLFTVLVAGLGARVVNALAFAAIVLLVGLVVLWRTKSVPAALVASVLTLSAHDVLTYSASALSEPVFVLLALCGLVLLAAHLERPRPALLVGAAALVGLACLTRYVGVALVVAGVGMLAWRRRWADAAIFGAVGALPLLGWLAWAGSGDRSVVFHPFGWDYLGQAVRPFSRWLVPWPGPPIGFVLAVGLVIAGAVYVRRVDEPLFVAFAATYLAVLVAYRLFTDASGRLDARFLLPVHVVAIVVVVPALWRRKVPPALAAVLVLAQVAGGVAWTVGGLTDDSISRRGYTAAAWDTSPVLASLPDTPVYSNAFDLIAFRGGEALPLPARKDYLTGRANHGYEEELRALRGYIAYFDAVTFRRSFLPSRAELEAVLPLEVVVQDALGTLYHIR